VAFPAPRLGLGERFPRLVENYLLPREHVTIAVRKHPGVFLSHSAAVSCWCVAACLVTGFSDGGALILGAIWGGFAVLTAWLVVRAAAWRESFFVATETRLIFIEGLMNKKVVSVPLREIGVLKGRRSRLGRLLGYGEFVAEPVTPGYIIPRMKYMPYMGQLLAELRELLQLEDSGG
jgi:hypothetical protein